MSSLQEALQIIQILHNLMKRQAHTHDLVHLKNQKPSTSPAPISRNVFLIPLNILNRTEFYYRQEIMLAK